MTGELPGEAMAKLARERLPSVIETLPRRLRESNAAQFLAIVDELQRSYVLELEVVQRVARVDIRRSTRGTHVARES